MIQDSPGTKIISIMSTRISVAWIQLGGIRNATRRIDGRNYFSPASKFPFVLLLILLTVVIQDVIKIDKTKEEK